MKNFPQATCVEIAAAFREGAVSARAIVEASLARIEAHDSEVNAFTDVLGARALARADALDAARARGDALGPLAGVPFAVKNLFDAAGYATRAGSKINNEKPPADADATLIRKLEDAGAILVGCLNMGEYAYDFTGENAHYGPSRNPHDLTADRQAAVALALPLAWFLFRWGPTRTAQSASRLPCADCSA
jgi:1-carboxybiuret hydrolase